MRTLRVFFLMMSLACSRGPAPSAPTAPATGFTPESFGSPVMHLWPGDLRSAVVTDPPRFFVQLSGVGDNERMNELIDALAKRTSVIAADGTAVQIANTPVGLPLASAVEGGLAPAGYFVQPAKKLGSGWYTLRIDAQALAETDAEDVARGGLVDARINVTSAPTVRRIIACSKPGELRIDLSEPMRGPRTLPGAVRLMNEDGSDIACKTGLGKGALDGDGERIAVTCEEPLPAKLRVAIDPRAFTSRAAELPLLSLEGEQFDRVLALDELPGARAGEEDCRLYVP